MGVLATQAILMIKYFTEHPETVGENYLQHLVSATGFGLCMICNGLACLLHGLFPFLFVKTGSEAIQRLYGRMVTNRSRLPKDTAAGQMMPKQSS